MPSAIKSGNAMIRRVMAVMFLLLAIVCPLRAAAPEPVTLTLASDYQVFTPALPLSHLDLLWLAAKRTLTVGVYGTETPPLNMNTSTGRYRGMNADYLLLLENSLQVRVVIKHYADQPQALAALQGGNLDLILTSPSGGEPLAAPFTASLPLVRAFPTLVTRQADVMKPLSDEHDAVKVAIKQGYPSDAFIKTVFPQAQITAYADNYLALASVANKENDYFFGNNLTSSFILVRDFYQALDMVKFWREPQTGNAFIVLASQPQLRGILDTFISSLSEQTHKQVAQSWVDNGNISFLNKAMKLTPQEERWVSRHPVLHVLINPYYAPFSMIDDNQEIRGLLGDILNLIQLQTGLSFEPVIANSNSDMVNIMRKGGWDILPTATYSTEREEQMLFTHPFIATPFVLVTRATSGQEDSLSPGSKVAIPAYHPLSEKLKKKYPGVTWVIAENTSTALSKLMLGDVDAVVSTQLASRFIIDHYYPEMMTYTRIPDEPSAQIAFAIPRDALELQSILNKALDDIPPKEILNLAGKWVKAPDVKIGTWNLYNRPFYLVAGLAALLVISSLLWGVYLLRAISRGKASQAALSYQLILRQTLSNAIPVPVYVITPDGELESYNSAFGEFFTPERREAMRYSLYDRRSPLADVFPDVQQEIQKGLTPDTVITHQLVLNNGEEDRLILHWLTSCRMPDELPATLICGWQDITESRQLMKALQVEKDKAIDASQAKSRFLASMSHEIRTPVSSIMGFLELLTTRKQSAEEAKDTIELAYSTAQTLIGLIGDVLDMEKIESGNFTLTPEWVDLDSLIHTTVANFDGLARQKNLRLTVDCRLEAGKTLWLDPQATKQVLANLLSNAVKFTQEGGVEVMAHTQALGEERVYLSLSVRDSGPGISAGEQQQLFKPFSQTQVGKRNIGSGLGLVICREMVERMAGHMSIASQPGMGTTMMVTLMTQSSDHAPAVPLIAEQQATLPAALRILIAEDNPTNRLLLRRQLDMLGYHVDEAEDGLQALSLIQKQEYDLLITDLNMPHMDGITLTRRVRERDQQMVIWGLTANAQTDEKERCLAAGMNMCLFKPIDLQQLKAALSGMNLPAASLALEEFVDMPTLEAHSLGDKKLMMQMLEQAQTENENDLTAASQALAQQEWGVLQHHLHRINGTLQLLSATALHELAEKLEDALAAGETGPVIKENLNVLEQQIRMFNSAIEMYAKTARH
ncbi:response regulator [Rahnella victoriana]|uniref:response regulator n=1 Tax=Rahnella victoriana TaxID=1510570 RepID=UPI001F351CBC|nr:transporter substrate-binding domain-containing protein [Rahnella victoriana]